MEQAEDFVVTVSQFGASFCPVPHSPTVVNHRDTHQFHTQIPASESFLGNLTINPSGFLRKMTLNYRVGAATSHLAMGTPSLLEYGTF